MKKESGSKRAKIYKGLSDNMLSKTDLLFIDDFIETGMQNAWQSYLRVFKCDERSAKTSAYRILKREVIQNEIQARLNASRATESYIIESALAYVTNGQHDPKASGAGQKSLEMLAKMKGLMRDDIRLSFDKENPAVFSAPFTKEEMEKMQEERNKMGRITE